MASAPPNLANLSMLITITLIITLTLFPTATATPVTVPVTVTLVVTAPVMLDLTVTLTATRPEQTYLKRNPNPDDRPGDPLRLLRPLPHQLAQRTQCDLLRHFISPKALTLPMNLLHLSPPLILSPELTPAGTLAPTP